LNFWTSKHPVLLSRRGEGLLRRNSCVKKLQFMHGRTACHLEDEGKTTFVNYC
jgi:hypothetical protein